MVKVRALLGVFECFRSLLDPPVSHADVPCNSHPIQFILDNNLECDPLPTYAYAPDWPEGLEIVL